MSLAEFCQAVIRWFVTEIDHAPRSHHSTMAAPSSTPSLSSRRGARKKATERIPQGQLIFYGLVFLLLGFLCLLVSDDELLANGESFFDLTPSPPAISYIDLNQTTNVSCGVHSAISCAECPQGNGQSWFVAIAHWLVDHH